MTHSRCKCALVGGLLLSLGGGVRLHAQDSGTRCDSAAAVVARGHPASADQWAFYEVRRCGPVAARAFAEGFRRYRTERDVGALNRFMMGVDNWRDASLLDAALEMATDGSATPEARVFAVRHLIALVAPHYFFTYDGIVRSDTLRTAEYVEFKRGCAYQITAEQSGNLRGSPLPADYEPRIRTTLKSLAESPSAPTPVRNAARCMARIRRAF